MSSLAFLVTELQSLASETRRKHPDIREAAEKSLAILRASPEQATANLASDGPQSDDLLRPVFMGCATKNAKVVAISLGSLQRLIALKAVPQSAVELIINTMSDAMSQGVDIQLRILQTLLSLVTNFPAVHGSLLGEALLLCFKLQESKIAVVSSTAAATLRQLVMFVFDKMVDEDRRDDPDTAQWAEMKLPNGTTKSLGPSARDAFSVFEDLCLLANSEKPNFLKLEFLHKTFALELIESVLTNYHDLFRRHTELVLLLQLHLCPLLLKALSDRPLFPLTLRCTRVVFLLLKQFALELETEAEIFLMLLIKIIGEDHSEQSEQIPRPQWMRVLAMEIMRGLCSDAELMRNVWARYDAHHSGSNVFTALITALKRLVTEKPALLGVSTQIFGVGVQPDNAGNASNSGYGLDVAGMAGMVATAASATVSGVVGMMGSTGGLSLQGSAMKLQCIDQLDKADAPPIPESYIYLLAVQCIVSLCEGFAAFTGPLYSTIVIQRPRAAGEAVIRAPPALNLASLPENDPSTVQLRIVSAIIESGWPALLAALSFIIGTNLSDDLFVEVLASYQAMTNVAGMLGLTTPRDAFFTSLSKFAVPTRVVSSLDHSTSASRRGPAQLPGLSERNLACLKVLVASALFLAGSLGESWFGILEALQNADYVLTSKAGGAGTKRAVGSRTVSSSGGGSGAGTRHALLSDLEPEALQGAIQRLFDASKNLEDDAFRHFINALCKLSAEMVGMQTDGESQIIDASERNSLDDTATLSPKFEAAHRRRVSGIHLPRTLRSGDFGINKLGGVALLNIYRLIYRSPDVAWDTTTNHLLSIICLPYAPQSIRVQAARVLDEILVIVPRNISTTGDLQAQVQKRVLDVLAQQVVPDYTAVGGNASTTTSVELRRMGLETLHQILEASGHTLVVGWETIFEMLASVCKPLAPAPSASLDSTAELGSPSSPVMRTKPMALGLGNPSEKSYTALVKIAFQSLTLVCDSVSSLSPAHLRLCISTLAQFGRQADTNIALTAAASLLWSVSDAIQSKRKNAEEEPEYNSLWMFLLLEVLGLCTDARPEVRDGAIQTLFRTMQLYGGTLSQDTWDQCIWKVTFPLLDSLTTEIRRCAIASPARTPDAAPMTTATIIHLDSFVKAWDVFVNYIQDTVLLDNRSISPPALRSLEKAVKASSGASADVKAKVTEVWERVWKMADSVGDAIVRRGNAVTPNTPASESPHKPFTQDSLVTFLDVMRCTRSISRALEGAEWPLERLTRLMAILKGILTYPSSPDYRPDIDQLPPVQAIVLETIVDIDLSATGCPSLIMRDLSEFATLPFLAAFDVPANPKSQTPQKRITYIALAKKEIFTDGTIEAVLSAYSIPVKLKYDCPPASKFGHDLPLWKTATSNFLKVVKECVPPMQTLGSAIPDEHIEGIWRQVLDVFRGGILADCSATESFPLEKQEEEENFDLALIGALEIDVVPHLGEKRVPDALVGQFARVLQQGSRLYESELGSNPHSPVSSSGSREFEKIEMDGQYENGSTQSGALVPRERFSYWCFDLLFLICSNTTKDQEPSRRRLAALSLPSLLSRCRTVMMGYVADEALRGNLPFPRAREDELLYVLRKLLELRLWPGSLWAAMSEEPSSFAVEQPAVDASLSPPLLIADAVKRSSIAHLFHFYPVLCEIASIPRKTPSTWVLARAGDKGSSSEGEEAVELDARVLARECLKEVGREMGVC
ncbi:Protein MON2 [Mycena venus]|uniref:Protein MON2 n=1 Tax=Mycena venus TaxID=2733690 RepID=A0A8H6X311_9AGAR|nr:Protein MON2 [Mycena venus]